MVKRQHQPQSQFFWETQHTSEAKAKRERREKKGTLLTTVVKTMQNLDFHWIAEEKSFILSF